MVALVLVIVGPLLGTLLALVLVPADPSDVVSVDGDRRVDLAVEATVRSIDAATGEMSVRLVLPCPARVRSSRRAGRSAARSRST